MWETTEADYKGTERFPNSDRSAVASKSSVLIGLLGTATGWGARGIAVTTESSTTSVTHIQPSDGWRSLDLRELWDRRELVYFLTWRDIKVRYKQTLFGVLWALAAPLANTVIFVVIFGRVAKMPTDGLPDAVFYLSGLVIWRYFATALSATSNSLVGNQAILTKIYFPRLAIPLSACLTGLIDFAIAFAGLLLVMIYYQVTPGWPLLLLPVLLPVLVATTMAAAMGVGLVFSSLNVKYRDVAQIVPFVAQFWMFCTVIVPFSHVPERFGDFRYAYGLNPMGGIVETFRWCLLQGAMDPATGTPARDIAILLAIGIPVSVFLLGFGLVYFKRLERMFADIV